MNQKIPKYPRILAIAPTTVGFGFALFEGRKDLVNWGVKAVEGDKNRKCLSIVQEFITYYQPNVIVLEDTSAKGSKRSPRTKALTKKIAALASLNKARVVLFSRKQIREKFFTESEGTKQEIAEMIAKLYPEELAHRLPPKRRPWKREDSRMGLFDAVALALMLR